MRWGPDREERAAVAKKAHDAYATARQAVEKIAAAECAAAEATRLAVLGRQSVATYDGRVARLERLVDLQGTALEAVETALGTLQRAFDILDARVPAPVAIRAAVFEHDLSQSTLAPRTKFGGTRKRAAAQAQGAA